jgi:diguanylate cyclase (GGDEF)-like protein/PAS domain S-box-containing protein
VLCASVRDVTERRLAQEALRQSEERYVRAARGANDGLWDWDLTSGGVYFSPRWKAMLGLSDHHLGGFDQWLERVHDDDHSAFLAAVRDHIEGRTEYFEHQHRMLHADGSYRWMLCRGLLARDENGKPTRMAGSQTDVTERHLADEQLRHAALHDALTGLPNRALFAVLLERAVTRTLRHPDDMFAVLFVDVDRFKVINDSLGHLVGDQLLQEIGRRIRDCLRSADVVARFGGDEFTILADDIGAPDDAVAVAGHVQDALKQRFVVGGHEISVNASIGIAVGSIHYQRGEELLRDADIAMYRAKALGKNRCEVFEPTMGEGALARLTLENDLRGALERQEFVLVYQPIFSLASARVVGFEALVRWHRRDGTLLLPAEFIPLAEETGLIVPLGAWVLDEACRQLAAWQGAHPTDPPLTVAVNITARQLEQPGFIDEVALALRDSGVAPGTLHLEITESALVDSSGEILQKLWQLKEFGVRLHLDDFGIGYSSLSYLHRFPLDMIKIDRSFIIRMESREKSDTVVEAIISLGKNLGMGVVAEGVETAGQVALLQAAACDQVQGYFFSAPLDADGVAVLLRLPPAAICA